MRNCRIGFVGAGRVATRHAKMLGSLPDARLVSVTDALPDRARRFGETFDVRAVPEVRAKRTWAVGDVAGTPMYTHRVHHTGTRPGRADRTPPDTRSPARIDHETEGRWKAVVDRGHETTGQTN